MSWGTTAERRSLVLLIAGLAENGSQSLDAAPDAMVMDRRTSK